MEYYRFASEKNLRVLITVPAKIMRKKLFSGHDFSVLSSNSSNHDVLLRDFMIVLLLSFLAILTLTNSRYIYNLLLLFHIRNYYCIALEIIVNIEEWLNI